MHCPMQESDLFQSQQSHACNSHMQPPAIIYHSLQTLFWKVNKCNDFDEMKVNVTTITQPHNSKHSKNVHIWRDS